MDCLVFPDPSSDPLAGIEGDSRLAALAAMLEAVDQYLRDRLGAVRTSILRNPPPSSRAYIVDGCLVEREAGLTGVRRIIVAYASNGSAMTVPSLTEEDLVPVHPVFVVNFGVEEEWSPESRRRPFFAGLAALLQTDDLVFGYSPDFDL